MITGRLLKTDAEWRELLPAAVFEATRARGTERPFSGEYHDFKGRGAYHCECCGNDLFSSEAKFDSGTGWPSYWAQTAQEKIRTAPDTSHGMTRTEVLCARCDAHLGHVFEDGPPPTGLRYCMNSMALKFVPG